MNADQGTARRWQGYTHQELYDMLHTGPGGSAAGTAADRWSGLSSSLADIQQDISAGVTASGAAWTGGAADAARDALGPLGDWARQASNAAEVMRVSTELQGSLLGRARADMPAPVPVTAERPSGLTTTIAHLFGAQTDYEIQEAASNAATQKAYQVMLDYESGTQDNTETLGEFGLPPELVVDTAPITSAGPVRVHAATTEVPAPRTATVRVTAQPAADAAGPTAADRPGTVEISASTSGDPAAPTGTATVEVTTPAGSAELHATLDDHTASLSVRATPAAGAPSTGYLVAAENAFGDPPLVSPAVIGADQPHP